MKKLFTLSLGLFLGAGLLISANLKSEKVLETKTKDVKVSFYFVSKEVKGTMTGKATFNVNKEDMTKSSFEGTAQVNTIDTQNKKRDEHLKSADYFNAESFPTISLSSKTIVKDEAAKGYKATCDVTIKDVTKEITLTLRKSESGWQARGKLYALDFGVSPAKKREESLVKIKLTM